MQIKYLQPSLGAAASGAGPSTPPVLAAVLGWLLRAFAMRIGLCYIRSGEQTFALPYESYRPLPWLPYAEGASCCRLLPPCWLRRRRLHPRRRPRRLRPHPRGAPHLAAATALSIHTRAASSFPPAGTHPPSRCTLEAGLAAYGSGKAETALLPPPPPQRRLLQRLPTPLILLPMMTLTLSVMILVRVQCQ